jgi:DNA mismatch repair ATPase MutS
VDISTGEFFVAEIPQSKLNNFIEMLAPAEVLFSKSSKEKLQPFIEKHP